jgi:hypothetical protein
MKEYLDSMNGSMDFAKTELQGKSMDELVELLPELFEKVCAIDETVGNLPDDASPKETAACLPENAKHYAMLYTVCTVLARWALDGAILYIQTKIACDYADKAEES